MFRRELKIATLSCSSSLMQLKELNKRRMYRKSPLRATFHAQRII